MKPRNKTATNPLLKKGHAHRSKKDYDRKRDRRQLRRDIANFNTSTNTNNK